MENEQEEDEKIQITGRTAGIQSEEGLQWRNEEKEVRNSEVKERYEWKER